MSDAFIGEIRAFPYDFVVKGWFECDGSLKSVSQYQALFVILGTTYGGDGRATFGVPNLQARAAIGQNTVSSNSSPSPTTPIRLGQAGGAETVALQTSQSPSHTHLVYAESAGFKKTASSYKSTPTANVSFLSRYFDINNTASPVSYYAYDPATPSYTPPTPPPATVPANPVQMAISMLGPQPGSGTPHANQQPFLTLRFCICYDGVFPTRP